MYFSFYFLNDAFYSYLCCQRCLLIPGCLKSSLILWVVTHMLSTTTNVDIMCLQVYIVVYYVWSFQEFYVVHIYYLKLHYRHGLTSVYNVHYFFIFKFMVQHVTRKLHVRCVVNFFLILILSILCCIRYTIFILIGLFHVQGTWTIR